ncbi:MAG: hypothetical protein HYX34_03965 [Actinobacteria bacterium]|nr:hypothetical protein [Actinomycetota bacterium]
MPGKRKLSPIEAFELNMSDAHQLVKLVEGFKNQRAYRMRAELRNRIGDALRIADRKRSELDCLQSGDVFLTFLPGSRLARADFEDPRPLLRQSLVAACAAVETYLGDKVMQNVGPLLRSEATLTPRLGNLQLGLEAWMRIEQNYKRKRWGLREFVVEPYVRENCSTAPNKVGVMLSLVGLDDWAKKVDGQRRVARGETVKCLERITGRRNRIAHQGDRVGRGRASLDVKEVEDDLAALESIVRAIEALL